MKSVLQVLVAVGVLLFGVAGAQELKWGDGDDSLFLPDGRALPVLPKRLEGVWTRDQLRVISWKADLAEKGDRFEGKVAFSHLSHLAPLTVQGVRNGDVVEFFVRFGENEVSYFSGHVAGTSVVGVLDRGDGQSRQWAGSWIDDTMTVTPAN